MTIGPSMQRCGTCGQEWWDAHACPLKLTAALPVVPSPSRTVVIGGPYVPVHERGPQDTDHSEMLRLLALSTKLAAELATLEDLARRSARQLRKWSEWYGNADHAARGQLPLPPAGDVDLADDIAAALGPKLAVTWRHRHD